MVKHIKRFYFLEDSVFKTDSENARQTSFSLLPRLHRNDFQLSLKLEGHKWKPTWTCLAETKSLGLWVIFRSPISFSYLFFYFFFDYCRYIYGQTFQFLFCTLFWVLVLKRLIFLVIFDSYLVKSGCMLSH